MQGSRKACFLCILKHLQLHLQFSFAKISPKLSRYFLSKTLQFKTLRNQISLYRSPLRRVLFSIFWNGWALSFRFTWTVREGSYYFMDERASVLILFASSCHTSQLYRFLSKSRTSTDCFPRITPISMSPMVLVSNYYESNGFFYIPIFYQGFFVCSFFLPTTTASKTQEQPEIFRSIMLDSTATSETWRSVLCFPINIMLNYFIEKLQVVMLRAKYRVTFWLY